jgi:hypothetical protein
MLKAGDHKPDRFANSTTLSAASESGYVFQVANRRLDGGSLTVLNGLARAGIRGGPRNADRFGSGKSEIPTRLVLTARRRLNQSSAVGRPSLQQWF